MVRGLDGFLITLVALCSCEGPRSVVSQRFPVAMARGKHLFPFRTEPLSPSAPMVLGPQGPGRVGRRRFFLRAVHPFTMGGSLRFRICAPRRALTLGRNQTPELERPPATCSRCEHS